VRPTRIAPRSVTCRDPARCAARHSEERRVPHPVDRGRASRHGPTVENRAPCLRRGRSPCSVRSRAPCLRRGRSLCSIEADARCSEECRSPPRGRPARKGGDGCARKRPRCGDAPIRRSESPRHRPRFPARGRSPRHLRVEPPGRYPRRSADAAAGGRASPGTDMAPVAAPEQALTAIRRTPLGFPDRGRRVPSRCARTHRGGPASELVEISRSSRLQGVAPLTSPS